MMQIQEKRLSFRVIGKYPTSRVPNYEKRFIRLKNLFCSAFVWAVECLLTVIAFYNDSIIHFLGSSGNKRDNSKKIYLVS